jgi:hypothetical protein
MDRIRDFDTSVWTASTAGAAWPHELLPLRGAVFPPHQRPGTPGQSELPTTETAVRFNRVRISVGHFLESWIERRTADIGPDSFNLDADQVARLRSFQLEALLGERFSSTEVESERKFSPKALSKAGIDLRGSWNRVRDDALDEAWRRILPAELARGFFPGIFAPSDVLDESTSSMWRDFLPMIDQYEHADFSTARRAFQRKILPSGSDQEPFKQALSSLQSCLHADFEASVQALIEHPGFKILLSRCQAPHATSNEMRFWYTSRGPWASSLRGRVPALRGSICSLYERLSAREKDQFDQSVFLSDTHPSRELLLKLLGWSTAYADGIEDLRRTESRRMAQSRHRKGKATRERFQGEVPYDPCSHDGRIRSRTSCAKHPSGAWPD